MGFELVGKGGEPLRPEVCCGPRLASAGACCLGGVYFSVVLKGSPPPGLGPAQLRRNWTGTGLGEEALVLVASLSPETKGSL